tara:strand:- start:204 stop:1760 length:1557 start_codon:yes stop_codon:yes gene_type:complete
MLKKTLLTERFDYIILLLVSFFINYYYSNVGVFPQDTFAYFDTGYRVLNGSVPFKDYWTVSGPFIDYFQAFLFYIFGISWKTYIINGSIINSIITLILYRALKIYNQERLLNIFYCVCFSILANPSMGVAFPDHYSAFFSLMAILFFLIAIKKNEKIFWLLIPIFYFIAFFSKQSPASYLLLPVLISSLLYIYYYKKLDFIKYFFISSFFCIILLFLFFYFNKIDFNQFLNQYIFFPQTIAKYRLKNYQFDINNLFFQFKWIYVFLIPLIVVFIIQIFKNKIVKQKKIFIINITVIVASIVLIFHQVLTKNFIFIFFLIPFIGSIIHLNLQSTTKYKTLISILLISVTLLSTIKYHFRFNENRKMLNLEKINLDIAINAKLLHPSLNSLKWITREYSNSPITEIKIIKENMRIIKEDKTKKMLLSGYLFFSAILDEDLNNPSRWPSLVDASNPDVNNKYYKFYEEFVRNLIKTKKIETLYSTIDNQDDVFVNIFDKNCVKTKVINDFLTKHDIRGCKK